MMFNKKGIVRIIVVVVCLVVVIVLLSRCGGSPIVGRWEVVENGLRVDYGVIRNLEFFGDGTYTSDHSNYFGSYSIEGNRLRISGVLASQKTFSCTKNLFSHFLLISGGVPYPTDCKIPVSGQKVNRSGKKP